MNNDTHHHRQQEEDSPSHISSDYNRPRRPNPETISYLRGLLPLLMNENVDDSNNQNNDTIPLFNMAFTALCEVKYEIASLCGDEIGAILVERIARICCPLSTTASRILLNGLSSYHLHNSTHRYGSHVIQTVLELACSTKHRSDSTNDDIDMALQHDQEEKDSSSPDDSLPTLPALIHSMVDELLPYAALLSIHVCGSHVLRTLLCVVSGVHSTTTTTTLSITRRGKPKNKKKKSNDQEGNHYRQHADVDLEYRPNESRLPLDEFNSALQRLTESLTETTASDASSMQLQQLACHASAGPLLIVLLRVLTYREANVVWTTRTTTTTTSYHLGIMKQEPRFGMNSAAHKLCMRVLCIQDTSTQLTQQVLYGMSGEPRGSHFVEWVFKLAPDELYQQLYDIGDYTNHSTLHDYIQHHVGNFVIQTLLCTVRTSEQAESLLKCVEKSVNYVVDSTNKRRGILWRAVELAAKYRVRQESLLKAIRVGMGQVYKEDDNEEEEIEAATEETKKKKKKRQKTDALSIPECIPKLLNIQPPESDEGRVGLDTAGARTVYHLMQFHPKLCEDVLVGIIEHLSRDELEWISKDGLGSRCIIDGILDGPRNQRVFDVARQSLRSKLEGRWVGLSVHRVGHHAVLKLFQALDMNDKATLVAELAQSMQRLSGNAMGRSVMEQCAVKQFLEGETAWKEAVRKRQKREEFLKELEGAAGVEGGDDVSQQQEEGGGGGSNEKKKRKRKRKRSEKVDGSDEKKPAKQATSAVDSIVKTLTGSTK